MKISITAGKLTILSKAKLRLKLVELVLEYIWTLSSGEKYQSVLWQPPFNINIDLSSIQNSHTDTKDQIYKIEVKMRTYPVAAKMFFLNISKNGIVSLEKLILFTDIFIN